MLLTIILQAAASAALAKMGAALGAGIAVLGAGLGIGKIGAAAMEGMSRQPEAMSDLRSNMLVAVALIEGATLFAIVVAILIIFV
jgi:ATP synthase, F0 subunit c